MKAFYKSVLLIFVTVVFLSCSPKVAPYAGGPVISQKSIKETFGLIIEFMEIKPGVVFGDVGASSGAITVMMATLMDNSTIYIQDIDTTALNQKNLDKIIQYYSKQSKQDLKKKNKFHVIVGDETHSKLPDDTFDRIYSNATIHVFSSLDSMVSDLRRKLKTNGILFMRDSFKNDHGEGSYCSDPTCKKPLLTIDELLIVMKRKGFKIVKQ
jgi:ubiquinone/menaquinone biosynthesis C-methylase UbiE